MSLASTDNPEIDKVEISEISENVDRQESLEAPTLEALTPKVETVEGADTIIEVDPMDPIPSTSPPVNSPENANISPGNANSGNSGGNMGRSTRRNRQTTVRLNFYTAFSSLTGSSKFFFLFNIFANLMLAIIGFVAFGMSVGSGEQCDQPLLVYLIMYCLRIVFMLPVYLYVKLYSNLLEQHQQHQQQENQQQEEVNIENINNVNVNSANVSGNDSMQMGNVETTAAAEVPEVPVGIPPRTSPLYSVLTRTMSLLELFGTLWFVIGCFWLFSSDRCYDTSPWAYYTSLSFIIIGFTVVLFPFILIMCIIFCLPVVIIAIRLIQQVTGLNLAPGLNPQGRMQAARESAIKSIRTQKFNQQTTELQDEDAHCVICLVDYGDGDEMKFMPTCNHHFHSECVDQWLRVNKTCPLCVRDLEVEIENERSRQDNNNNNGGGGGEGESGGRRGFAKLKFWQKSGRNNESAENLNSAPSQQDLLADQSQGAESQGAVNASTLGNAEQNDISNSQV